MTIETRDSMRLTRTELALIAGFWTLFAALSIASRLLDRPDTTQLSGFASVAIIEALCWMVITPMVFMIAATLDTEDHRATQYLALAATGVAVAVLMGWLGMEIRSAFTPFGGGRGPNAAEIAARTADQVRDRVNSGRGGGGGPGRGRGPSIWFGLVNALVLYFAVAAAAIARTSSRRYHVRRQEAARREARLEGQLAEARLDALRRQLDPHFLFNTLNTVSALVERDPRGVRRMISRLSDMLRHSFEGGGEPEVTLRDELVMLTRYVEIMQVRFQGRLTVDTDADDEALDGLVPTMILQPLVENAIKHGIERITGAGLIEITADVERNGTKAELVLRVRDNGPGTGDVSTTPLRKGVGIANSAARLEQLYGKAHSLTLAPGESGGAVAEIRLPYHVANGAAMHG